LAAAASFWMLASLTAPGGAQEASTTTPPPLPKAWALVDADTGSVLSASDDREAKPVASLSKIITALAVTHALQPGTDIPVSARAEGMPARKINMKAGQVWTLEDALASMMLSSANDAAVALGERASGSLEAFRDELDATAARIGMQDSPLLRDPAGLDDEFSVDGGNLISARDLAIAARALLAERRLAELVAQPETRFLGGDNIQHHLINHNRMLKTYTGAIGVKTGYTKRSGRCLVAAAQRDGRTMIAVVIDVYDTYGAAGRLLDQGFATPVSSEPADRLPAPRKTGPVVSVAPALPVATDPALADSLRRHQDALSAAAGVLLLAFLGVRSRRRRAWRARRDAAREARAASYQQVDEINVPPAIPRERWEAAVGPSSSPGPGHSPDR
jgi:D-alanyl-D-alanine carboxypeptidase